MWIKRCSLVLAIIILFTCVPALEYEAVYAEDTQAVYYEHMVDTLAGLGIIDRQDLKWIDANGYVTRAEMASLVIRMLGMETLRMDASMDEFLDVPPEHEAYNAVIIAYRLGIISGVGDEKFAPENNVTFGQAVKMIVCTLGYEQMAQEKGNFPVGHLNVALQLGLLKGEVPESSSLLTRRHAAELAYRALDAEVFEASYYSADGTILKIQRGKTLLTARLGLETVYGVVTQNNRTAIPPFTKGADGKVTIDSKAFSCGETDIGRYLGYKVKAYYDDTDDKILYYSIDEGLNNILHISSEDFVDIGYTGELSVSYLQNNRVKEVKSSGNYIYNGVAVNSADVTNMINDLAGKCVSFTLVDNDNDGDYDVVIVNAYYSVIAHSASANNQKISYLAYDALGNASVLGISLDTSTNSYYRIYNEDGKEIGLGDIKSKDVISVYKDLSGEQYELYVCTDNVTGEITAISEGEYTIGEKSYKIAPNTPDVLFKLGLSNKFLLDREGYIVGFDSSSAFSGTYGLLMDFNIVNQGLVSYPLFRILTSEGEFVTLEGEEKITAYNPASGRVEKTDISNLVAWNGTPAGYVDGGGDDSYKYMIWHRNNTANFIHETTKQSATEPFYYRPWLTASDKSNAASRKPIYYKVGSNGKINTVIVPDIPDLEHNKLTLMNNNDRYTFNYRTDGMIAIAPNAGTTSANGVDYIFLDEDATIFSAVALDYSESNYRVTTPSGIDTAPAKTWMYSVEGSTKARLVVRYTPLPAENSRTPFVVVRYVSRLEDGTLVLNGYSAGEEYKSVIAPNTKLIERKLSTAPASYNKITRTDVLNLEYADSSKYSGAAGTACYDYSLYTGNTEHPYADEENLHAGDIVVVGKDKRDEICYVEMAVRATDGIMLMPTSRSNYYQRLTGSDPRFGVVTGKSVGDEIYIDCIGEYNSTFARSTTFVPNNASAGTGNDSYKLIPMYYDANMPHDLSQCKSIWIYDYKRGKMFAASASDIDVNDIVITRGPAMAPYDCIILQNYPF